MTQANAKITSQEFEQVCLTPAESPAGFDTSQVMVAFGCHIYEDEEFRTLTRRLFEE